METLLKVEHISKSFGLTKALDDVSIELHPGEVRGLVGENGSGKSTLSNIIVGIYDKYDGKLFFKGEEYQPKSILQTNRMGISLLAQETGTISGMTVYENMFLGEETSGKSKIVSIRRLRKETRKILDSNGLEKISPDDVIDKYSFEDRKMIEVARAVHHDPRILIVDETTTALSHYGRQRIYEVIRQMREKGNSVIFISHDLDEIISVCDTVTILRDGHYIDTLQKDQLDKNNLRSLMIGRELTGSYYRADWECTYDDQVVLEARNIEYKNILHDVSIQLHKGEILGLGGLTESGMHEICKVLFGAIRPDSGKVLYCGDTEIHSTTDCVNRGIAYIPKDRDTESLFISANIRDNIVASSYDSFNHGVFILPKKENELASRNAAALEVKMGYIRQQVGELSGGNKQKVAICKWLANDSEIFLMDCPTRGIDVGVKANIYQLMQKLKQEGKAILMVSEELTELIGMSDRILIVKDGGISAEFLRQERPSERSIIEKML